MGTTADTETQELARRIDRTKGLVASLKEDLPPSLEEEAAHLEEDMEVLESWTEDAEDEQALDALDGSLKVVGTAQVRVSELQDRVGDGDEALQQRLEEIQEELDAIEDELRELDVPTSAFVTYVDRSFAARYQQKTVKIGTILEAEGFEDVDELGLWPLDGLFGARKADLAFPHNQEVDLSEQHRTYWQSESDGGLIA